MVNHSEQEENLTLQWNKQGKISDINIRLAYKLGFESSDGFISNFKNIDRFLIHPKWEFLKKNLLENSKIKHQPLLAKSAEGREDQVSLISLEADLQVDSKGQYQAVFRGDTDNISIVNEHPSGVFISTPEGSFIHVNSRLVQLYGYDSQEEMLALNIAEEIYYDPKVRDYLMKSLSDNRDIKDFKFIARRKDGQPILVSKSVYSKFRYKELIYFYGFVEDITNENTEDLISDHILFWKCTFEGQIIHVSNAMAKSLGYSQKELLGKNVSQLYFEFEVESIKKANWIEPLKKEGRLHHSFFFLKHKDNSPIKFEVDVALVKDQVGNDLYVIGKLLPISSCAGETSWIAQLKGILDTQTAIISAHAIEKAAKEVNISKLTYEEIKQISNVIKKVISENELNYNIQMPEVFNGNPFSLSELIELAISSSLFFFAERKKFLSDALTLNQVATLLKISEEEVKECLQTKKLLGIMYDGEIKFPVWQFDLSSSNGILHGLSDLLAAMEVSDFSKLSWLMSENMTLEGRKPFEILRDGSKNDRQRVLEEAFGVGGF